ncbi:TRAP transporter small permease [Candidatus Pacearchaeota archaeon]|nr:TRAP transporter small permease [Candidatus Pacearchaeota archaeon]
MAKIGRALDKVVAYLGHSGAAAGVISLIIMTVMITLNVLLRFFANKPQLFVEEFSAYLFICIVYMGLAHTTRIGAHISVELVVRQLPQRVRTSLEVLTSVVALALMAAFFKYSWDLFMRSIQMHHKADSVFATPLWIPQSLIWIGLAFFCFAIVSRAVQKFVGLQKKVGEEKNE